MKNTSAISSITALIVGASLIVTLVLASIIPMLASAATYAYVDASGDVRSVTANDWMTAINTAPNIHTNSGVLLLISTSDFTIVGDTVAGY